MKNFQQLLLIIVCLASLSLKANDTIPIEMLKAIERYENIYRIDSIRHIAPKFFEATSEQPESILHIWAKHYLSASIWRENPDSFYMMSIEVHKTFKEMDDFNGMYKSAMSLGSMAYYIENNVSKSSEYYRFGIELLESKRGDQLPDSTRYRALVLYLNNLSINTNAEGNYPEALELALQAKSYLEYNPNHHRLNALCIMNLANINAELRNFEKSLEYNRALLTISKKMDQIPFISMALNNIAGNFGELDKLDSSIVYLKQSYDLTKSIGDFQALALRASNLGFAYNRKKQFEIADQYYREAIDLLEGTTYATRKIIAMNFMADNLMAQNKIDEAVYYIQEAKRMSIEGGHNDKLMQSYQLLHFYSLLKGNYALGKSYYETLTNMQDSIKGEEVLKQVEELQTKYNTAEKEKENLRLKKEAEITALKLKQRSILIFLTAGILGLITLSIYLIGRQRNLQEQQKTQMAAQKLRRAQMNPHFFFNALTSIQSLIAESEDKKKQLTYVGRFANLMRQTLEQSFQEFIPLEEEIQSLENYLKLQQLRFDNKFDNQICC
ncbi:MAG: histidine kinase, partial [Bacteroidota bacterium]